MTMRNTGKDIRTDLRKENSYRNVIKRISAFGGVQVFNILISLVRGKFVAMFLGPEGMGINSLFVSSTNTLQQMGSLGLNLAFVKEISAAREDAERLPFIIRVARTLIFLTSLFGGAITIILSPWLSQWSFGSYDYTLSYVALGIFVALSIAGSGYLALLQGLSEVKRLSKASLVGSCTGLLVGVPLYYIFGTRGIVPAMIILSVSIFLFYYTGFRRAVTIGDISYPRVAKMQLVRKMMSIGFMLMIGVLASSAVNYGINAFVRMYGNLEHVGLFQAANSVTSQYMGVVFAALSMDYFPRLATGVRHRRVMRTIVNRQSELVLLIATPMVIALMWASPLIIKILLTGSFESIQPLMRWMALSILLHTMEYPLGYLFLAYGKRKVYFWVEAVSTNIIWAACSTIFYMLYGLEGLGIGLLVRGILDMVVVYAVCSRVYGFRYRFFTIIIISINLILGTTGFLLSQYVDAPYGWPCAIPMLASLTVTAVTLKRVLRTSGRNRT